MLDATARGASHGKDGTPSIERLDKQLESGKGHIKMLKELKELFACKLPNEVAEEFVPIDNPLYYRLWQLHEEGEDNWLDYLNYREVEELWCLVKED